MTRLVLLVMMAMVLASTACSKRPKNACDDLATMICTSSGESSQDCVKAKEMAADAKDVKTIEVCSKVLGAFNQDSKK